MKIVVLLLALVVWPLTTPAQSNSTAPRPVRVALVSDTHFLRKDGKKLEQNRQHLRQVISSVNTSRVDLVLIAGDLTEDGDAADFRAFSREISKFEAPVWVVPGNHDMGGKRIPGKPNPAKDVNRSHLWRYEWILGESYFVREIDGLRVVGVNSPLLGSGLRQERRMFRYFDEKLRGPADVPTVFLIHYPLFAKSPDESGGEYWNVEPEPRQRLLALVKQSGARAVLSGHLHTPMTNDFHGVLCYTTPPTSFGLPEDKQPEGWTLVTVPRDGKVTAEFRAITTKAPAAKK
jgi:3',5'-cyclic AMP phosphodiesterase CpdA